MIGFLIGLALGGFTCMLLTASLHEWERQVDLCETKGEVRWLELKTN